MMFGHLKAEEFMNLLEGIALSERKKSHFASCERCRQTLAAADAVRGQVARLSLDPDEDTPEPEWSEFRASVRDRLLSRSIKREAGHRVLKNWSWKPAMVWSMSAMFALGLTTGLFVWNRSGVPEQEIVTTATDVDPLIDMENVAVIDQWAHRDAFEELARLGADEAAVLGDLLSGVSEPGGIQ